MKIFRQAGSSKLGEVSEGERSAAVVTGASRGIGKAIALALADAGVNVVLVARSAEALQTVVDLAEGHGIEAIAMPGDVTDPAYRERLISDAWAWKGSVEFLVNAAGVAIRSEPPHVTETEWNRVLAVNTAAPFFLSQAFGSRMVDAGGGAITNVASVAAHAVTRASIAYQASKAAVVQVTRGLAKAFAPNVRVNAVGPGYIETDLNREWLSFEDNRSYVLARTPLGRIGSPADVTGAVLFLCSEEAAFVTGQHILVDGGWSVS